MKLSEGENSMRHNSSTEKARKQTQLKYRIEKFKQAANISKLEGKDSVLYKIGEVERHIRNVKYDIEMQGEHLAFTNKLHTLTSQLDAMKAQLKQIEQEVKV